MSRVETWLRWAALAALSATTAYAARWLRDSVDARARGRVPGFPAASSPPAARAEQRLADTRLWRLAERRLVRSVLTPYRVRPGLRPLRILDVDHGPGGVAWALAAAAPQDAVVVATDARAGMADLLLERASRRGARARLALVRARPERLPFVDGAFDLAVSAGALHDWRDAEGALREVRRQLAPPAPEAGAAGGRYLIADLRRDTGWPVWLLIRLAQSLFAPRALRALDEPSASYRAAYSPPEAEWLAARAKLPDLNVRKGAAWLMIGMRATLPPETDNPIPAPKENRQ
jgi:ubiquinone/menaquinone biosynthesis C-methylase UbiE